MTKRIRKSQVEQLMDKVSKMEGSSNQYHDLRKEYNPNRDRYSWRVNYYNKRGDWQQRFVGDTLAEALEHFEMQEEDERAKWDAEEAITRIDQARIS